jgi:hypothetical protein
MSNGISSRTRHTCASSSAGRVGATSAARSRRSSPCGHGGAPTPRAT